MKTEELIRVLALDGARPVPPLGRSLLSAVLVGLVLSALLFAAVLLQTGILAELTVFGGSVDLPLVTLLCIALLRGSIFGAVAGFWAGLLFDTATLGTLGFTSLRSSGRQAAYTQLPSTPMKTSMFRLARSLAPVQP